MGGSKLDYDLASNCKARKAEDMVKIQKNDYGIEAEIGLTFIIKALFFHQRSGSAMAYVFCTAMM